MITWLSIALTEKEYDQTMKLLKRLLRADPCHPDIRYLRNRAIKLRKKVEKMKWHMEHTPLRDL